MLITDKIYAPVKELHGVNCAPYNKRAGSNQTKIKNFFEYLGIPRSRLHDCCGAWGGTYFVDVPNIFRDFDADENNPENYDFHYSDEYVTAIIETGASVVRWRRRCPARRPAARRRAEGRSPSTTARPRSR